MYELCLCGSGKPYESCCKLKPNPYKTENSKKRFVAEFIKLRNNYKKMCLYPSCADVGICAHTISQEAVLSLIAKDNHVLMPIVEVSKPVDLILRGIEKQASTFYCFCYKHDGIFSPIDVVNPVLSDKVKFLYAYRIFASTYYKVQREIHCSEKLISKYDITSNLHSMNKLYEMKQCLPSLNRCKTTFDTAITTNDYNAIESVVATLDYKVYFSAAACFCPAFDLYGSKIIYKDNSLPMLYVSIVPDTTKTNLIFSWLKIDNEVYIKFAKQISIAPKRFIIKYLNNLMPLYCENIAIGPMLWEKWDLTAKDDFKFIINWGITRENAIQSEQLFDVHKYNLFLKIDN